MILNKQYKSVNEFRDSLQLLLVLPIKSYIRQSNKSLSVHCKEMNAKGLKIGYNGFRALMLGNNFYYSDAKSYSKLYEYFGLPFPSVSNYEQLFGDAIESELRYLQSKSNDKRFTKKALLPAA